MHLLGIKFELKICKKSAFSNLNCSFKNRLEINFMNKALNLILLMLVFIGTNVYSADSNFQFININNQCKAFLPQFEGASYKLSGKCYKGFVENKATIQISINKNFLVDIDGEFKNGLLNSINKFDFKDGTELTVKLQNGKWSSGTKIVLNKYRYSGDLNIFTEDGLGEIVFNDQSSFLGDFVNGKRNGHGIFSNKDFEYVGNFKDDKFHGNGFFKGVYFDRKVEYRGEFTNSSFGPNGKLTSDFIYEGNFTNGVPSGKGKLYMPNRTFEGNVTSFMSEKSGGRTLEVAMNGKGKIYTDDNSVTLNGSWEMNVMNGSFSGYVKGLTIHNALFLNNKPTFGKFEMSGKLIYLGEMGGDEYNWKPNGMGELTIINSGTKTSGTRTVGRFIDWLKCVGQCFMYYNNGIIAAVQNDGNGKALPGTLLRIDEGAEEFYAAKNINNNLFSFAAQLMRDQQNAFKNIDTAPSSLNQTSPVTIINSTGKVIGNGTMWSTQQPGMINGGNFIIINK